MKNSLFLISVLASLCGSAAEAVKVDAAATGTPFSHFWSVGVGAGRVNEGLRSAWHEHLVKAKADCGFRYVRMHDTFNDDMFVCFPQKDGTIKYNWQYLDEVYDRMLDEGVKPFIEFSFFPKCLARENSLQQMWYRNNVSVDRNNFGKWHDLCKAFVAHLVARYGLEEVKTWRFEVWNEPNLNMYPRAGFFDGTKSDYFRLYKEAATAVKEVDPALKVGGPATSNFIADHRHDGEILDNTKSIFYPQETINRQQWKGVWIEEFLAFCAKEKLPVDFISCHPYPTDYALDPVSGRGKDAIRYVHSLRDDMDWLVKVRDASAYPNAEIHLTEWSSSPNSRDALHDRLPPCAYVAKAICENLNKVDSLMYWTFTDVFEEKGGGDEIFHGGFGLLNFQGIQKPTFNVFRMFNRLGDVALYNSDPIFVSKDSKSGKVSALLYNYPEEYESHVPTCHDLKAMARGDGGSAKEVKLEIAGLLPGARYNVETLDWEHGNVYDAWDKMGRPRSPSRSQIAALKEAGAATKKETIAVDADGVLRFARVLPAWVLVCVW